MTTPTEQRAALRLAKATEERNRLLRVQARAERRDRVRASQRLSPGPEREQET